MTFLQPYLLWGLLAASIPVAIHFWYRKGGKTIEWAAMRWLGERTTRQHRGLRLNEVWLMVLRCLLVALLALILSKPLVDGLKNTARREAVHLVQPDRLVAETYRFELGNALRNGEKVYWMGAWPEAMVDPEKMPAGNTGLALLQGDINALASETGRDFKLYFRSDVALSNLPQIYIPGNYQLFTAADSAYRKIGITKEAVAARGTIRVLLANDDAAERKTILAALGALAEVYGFTFETASKRDGAKHYDWVFTNQPVRHAQPGTKYIFSGSAWRWDGSPNVIQLRDTLRLADSELVEQGAFPEWLGGLLLKELGLNATDPPLATSQLNALFVKTDGVEARREASTRPWLLLGFIALLIAERWLALRQTTVSHG